MADMIPPLNPEDLAGLPDQAPAMPRLAMPTAVDRLAQAFRAYRETVGSGRAATPKPDLRANPDLDAVFGVGPDAGPVPAIGDDRPNPLLDEAVGRLGQAAESSGRAATPEPPPAGDLVELPAPDAPVALPPADPVPARVLPAEEAAVRRLGDAAEKLNQAAEKLAGLTAGDRGDSTPTTGGGPTTAILGRWAGQYLRDVGGRLGGAIEGKASSVLGRGFGRLVGEGARKLIGKGIGRLTRSGGGRAATSASRLATAARATAAASGSAGTAVGGSAGAGAGTAGAAGMAGGASSAVAAAGPVGVAVAAVLAVAEAAKQLHDAIVEGAKAQQEHNFRLAEFSASMAAVQADAEVRTIFRNQEVGERTASTAGELNESLQRYEDELKELRVLGDNFKNLFYSFAVEVINGAIKPFSRMAEYVNRAAEKYLSGGAAFGFDEFLEDVRQRQQDARDRGDERFRPGGWGGGDDPG